MKKEFLKFVEINEDSLTPKYRQVMDGILKRLESGELEKNDLLPSLHESCTMLEVSKNTIVKAYEELKRRGIVESSKGKGYQIVNCKLV